MGCAQTSGAATDADGSPLAHDLDPAEAIRRAEPLQPEDIDTEVDRCTLEWEAFGAYWDYARTEPTILQNGVKQAGDGRPYRTGALLFARMKTNCDRVLLGSLSVPMPVAYRNLLPGDDICRVIQHFCIRNGGE
jgi:hypothetical protein